MKVEIFIPCFIDQLFPETAFNMVKVLKKAGVEVSYNPNQTCCGQPAFNAGFTQEAQDISTYFQSLYTSDSKIITPSASCTGFINNYQPKLLLKENGLATSTEFSEFLTEELQVFDFNANFAYKVTYHDSCSALRECKIKEGPRKLLSRVKDLQLIEMQDNETCCGFGGTFAMKFAPISVAMAEQKLQNAVDVGAEYIVSTDLSCLMQIQSVAEKQNIPIKTIHLADVLASGW